MAKVYTYPIKLKTEGENKFVFDHTRRKWLKLTPEEKVRQSMLKLMVEQWRYPLGLITSEMSLKLNQMLRRADIVVFQGGKPWMIVECKAPYVSLTDEVLQQAARYNLVLNVPYIVLTNGPELHIVAYDHTLQQWTYAQEPPLFSE